MRLFLYTERNKDPVICMQLSLSEMKRKRVSSSHQWTKLRDSGNKAPKVWCPSSESFHAGWVFELIFSPGYPEYEYVVCLQRFLNLQTVPH